MDVRDGLYALAALALCLVIGFICRKFESDVESKQMAPAHCIAPQAPRELSAITILAASVAEEAAYRGVGFFIIWTLFGSPWLAAFVLATVFAFAHWIQGWKNVVGIFAIALVMQGLVVMTNTLVLAMVVHAIFDFVAFYSINSSVKMFTGNVSAR